MVLGSLDAEIDQIPGMGHDSAEAVAQRVFGEGEGVSFRKRLGKPLHVVLHKNLDRRAADADAPVNGCGDAAVGGDMGTQERQKMLSNGRGA